jgi:hypothetical protein
MQEKVILERMASDLERNASVLQFCIDYDKDNVRRLDIILDHLKNRLPYPDSLKFHFGEMIEYCSYDPATSTYDNLRSSKGLDLIKSDTIRKQIVEVHDIAFPFANENIRMEEDIVNQSLMLPLFAELFEIDPTTRAAYPVDYQALFDHQKLINVLQLSKDRRISSIKADEDIKKEVDLLLIDILNYLK